MYRMALFLVIFLGACAESHVAGGSAKLNETSVPRSQMDSVTRDVQQWHDVQHPMCKFESVIGTKILEREKNTASEQWTIKACGEKSFSYTVSVVLQSGGITDAVSNMGGSPLRVDSPEIK